MTSLTLRVVGPKLRESVWDQAFPSLKMYCDVFVFFFYRLHVNSRRAPLPSMDASCVLGLWRCVQMQIEKTLLTIRHLCIFM
jgi:hypothetical protein